MLGGGKSKTLGGDGSRRLGGWSWRGDVVGYCCWRGGNGGYGCGGCAGWGCFGPGGTRPPASMSESQLSS